MIIALSLISITLGSTLIAAVVQHEINLSPVEYLDAETGRSYRYTRIFGRTLKV